MDEDIKRDLKKMAKNAEIRLAESILRWKYKKERKEVTDENLGQQSETVANQAHRIIAKRGKNIWKGLKEAYRKGEKKEDSSD